jgi:AcrR family transcriptional regulator
MAVEQTSNAARRLPPGSHGIPADVVARNQRERLVAAMAEECAERGYAEVSVAAVAKRAGVSSVTFYKQFSGKEDCLLAAHRQLLGRLLEEVDRAVAEEDRSSEESREQAETGKRAAIHIALTIFAADPPSARLLTVEILAAGSEGVKRHDAMVEALSERLGAGWVQTAGVLALVGKLAAAGEADRLPELEAELVATLSAQS